MNKILSIARVRIFKFVFAVVQWVFDIFVPSNTVVLLTNDINQSNIEEIHKRISFYVPNKQLMTKTHLPFLIRFSSLPILEFNQVKKITERLRFYRGGIFDIDWMENPIAGWAWCRLAAYCSSDIVNKKIAREKFISYVDDLKNENFTKAYVLGTGPSLSEAMDLDWSDGYRIVCNTIVRDSELWNHINPHFIVAGDAVYHFSHTNFALTFRKDLALRLAETKTFFVYPAEFDQIIRKELKEFSDRLIPIPIGNHHRINIDLTQNYFLPKLGNVLPLLLLPLACTLSSKVFLWGFDGRAPKDQLFWSNSEKHSYPKLLPELQNDYPAFFYHFAPRIDPYQYVKQVHGDVLENSLSVAENEGWSFEMMHKSWTPTLQKRFVS